MNASSAGLLRVSVVGVVILAASTTACSKTIEVDAPPPTIVDDAIDSLPPLEASVVESEIRYDLSPALAAVETAVPRLFGDINDRKQMGGNRRAHFAFAAQRSPFRISVDGQRVAIGATVDYEGRGWYKPPIGPEVSAACGTGNVPRPRLRLRVTSTVGLTPEWSLSAKSRLAAVEPMSDTERDRCRVTVFRVDVTDRVVDATRTVLTNQLKTLDRSIAGVNTRARFERWWRDMSKPVRLADSIYLTINPRDVQLAGIRVDSGVVVATVRLQALPRITSGPRPNDFALFKPLPKLATGRPIGSGLRVDVEGELGYDIANDLLRKALVGKRIERGERHLVIQEATLMGIGAGRVALGVRFSGTVNGRVFLTGTPRYDVAADQLLVPDLALDLRTNDLLVRGLTWLKDDAIRDYLRERARFPVEGQLDRLRTLAEQGMNRQLAEGVDLVAQLTTVEGVSVRATQRALLVRAQASGKAHLDIDKPVAIKRPLAKTAKR